MTSDVRSMSRIMLQDLYGYDVSTSLRSEGCYCENVNIAWTSARLGVRFSCVTEMADCNQLPRWCGITGGFAWILLENESLTSVLSCNGPFKLQVDNAHASY